MKKFILSLGIAASLFASDKILPQNKTIEVLKSTPIYNQIAPLIKNGKIKTKATLKNGFYIIEIDTKRGRGLIYVTQNKKYTIIGRVLKNNGQMLIPNFPKNAAIVNNGVLFTVGKGKTILYIVTDPQCPFCRMMEREKKDVLKKDYTIHVILLPLSYHKDTKKMSYYVLAGKNNQEKAKRMQAVLGGSNEWKNFHPTKKQIGQFNNELSKSKKAAAELQVQGTPSVYDKNFNPIPWTELGKRK